MTTDDEQALRWVWKDQYTDMQLERSWEHCTRETWKIVIHVPTKSLRLLYPLSQKHFRGNPWIHGIPLISFLMDASSRISLFVLITQVTWLVVTEVRSERFWLVTERRQSYFCLLDVVDCNVRHISHRQVWYRTISLRCACIRSSGIILITGAKFRFFCIFHYWASPWKKTAYSINQPLTHPAYLLRREPKLSLRKICENELHYKLETRPSWKLRMMIPFPSPLSSRPLLVFSSHPLLFSYAMLFLAKNFDF